MSSSAPLNVLFLCTHNSARSILAEALLNHLGGDRFRAFSAGSAPREGQKPNPLAIEVLTQAGVPTTGLSSKSWDHFASADAPVMDLIVTVCDSAAAEVCPVWPGHAAGAHWGYADPSAVVGTDEARRDAFTHTLLAIRERIEQLVKLTPARPDTATLQRLARELSQR